jgi:hypothetical protein
MKWSTRNLLIFILVLLFLLILLLLFRCCRCCSKLPPPKSYHNGIVFWKNPNAAGDRFLNWVDSIKGVIRGLGEIKDSMVCANCDSSLITASGVGTEIYLSQGGSGGSGTTDPGGPSGGDIPGYFCANLDISTPDTISVASESKFPYRSTKAGAPGAVANAVTVGVFDTGDSLAFPDDSRYVGNVLSTCLLDPNSKWGWNFVWHNPNTKDDHPNKHGTKVSQSVIDQAAQYQQGTIVPPTNPVGILPVKIFSAGGKGTLFDLLCAVSYAAKGGVRIINASFGFYEYADTPANRHSAGLMEKYLEYYLPRYNMLMVAAAGNQDPAEDLQFHIYTGNPTANPRDLLLNPFYPACLAKTSTILAKNILVVTTVGAAPNPNTWMVSPLQNFSNRVVDVGVACDQQVIIGTKDYFCFRDPISLGLVTGSSFATPIITGKIASYFSKLLGTGPVDKNAIIRAMLSLRPYPAGPNSRNLLTTDNSSLSGSIRSGVMGVKTEQ